MATTSRTRTALHRCAVLMLGSVLTGLGGLVVAAEPPKQDRRPQMTAERQPIDAGRVAALLTPRLGDWKQTELGQPLPAPAPEPATLMRAVYTQAAHSAELTLFAGSPTKARSLYRELRPEKPDTLVNITLTNGLSITAVSRTADATALEALIRAIDLDKLEGLKPKR
jgi:hypothetical protein